MECRRGGKRIEEVREGSLLCELLFTVADAFFCCSGLFILVSKAVVVSDLCLGSCCISARASRSIAKNVPGGDWLVKMLIDTGLQEVHCEQFRPAMDK